MTTEEGKGSEETKPTLLDEWMTRKELAAELGVSERTLLNWKVQRIGPPLIRLKKQTLYRREAVREWLRSQESASGMGRQK